LRKRTNIAGFVRIASRQSSGVGITAAPGDSDARGWLTRIGASAINESDRDETRRASAETREQRTQQPAEHKHEHKKEEKSDTDL
jgi:hypothetical protein